MNVLKTSQSDTCCKTSLGRLQDINLNIFHEIGFQGNFSIFPDTKCVPDIAEPKVWFCYGTGRPDQITTIKGRPRDVLGRLGSIFKFEEDLTFFDGFISFLRFKCSKFLIVLTTLMDPKTQAN